MASKGCELDRCKAVDLGFIHDSLKLRHKNLKKKCEPYMATAMLNKKATCLKTVLGFSVEKRKRNAFLEPAFYIRIGEHFSYTDNLSKLK